MIVECDLCDGTDKGDPDDDCEDCPQCLGTGKMCDECDALRARLAEVETERDEARQKLDFVCGAVNDGNAKNLGDLVAELATRDMRARLAKVEGALRDFLDGFYCEQPSEPCDEHPDEDMCSVCAARYVLDGAGAPEEDGENE